MSTLTEPDRVTAEPTIGRPRRRWPVAVLSLAVAAAVTGGSYALASASTPDPADIPGPGVVTVPVTIEHSQFSIDTLTVEAGTLVRFEVTNLDPIHHELIVGPPAVHAAHRTGTELEHPPVPGELSLGPNQQGLTFYAFAEPGDVRFACHLPRHAEYGMVGTIEVVAPLS